MLNQFAKINPIVTSDGYLLEQDNDSNYTRKSLVRLKENEVGICIDDKSFIMLFNGEAIKIIGGLFNTIEEARAYAALNTNNSHTGEIIHIKNSPTKLYVLIGTKLYNLNENTKKSITTYIDPETATLDITNSTMQNPSAGISGKYILNSIDIKMGSEYSFKSIISSEEGTASEELEFAYAKLILTGAVAGSDGFLITDSFKNNTTSFVINKEFVGPLSIKLYGIIVGMNSYNESFQITNYEGNNIQLTIGYTPIT